MTTLFEKLSIMAASLAIFLSLPAIAMDDDNPDVIIVKSPDAARNVRYAEPELAKLYQYKVITTETPWTNGRKRTYRGFSLKDILKENGLGNARIIEGTAANDYSARLDVQEIVKFNPIIATQIDCAPPEDNAANCNEFGFRNLNVKDLGPFFLVWPYDRLPGATDPRDHSKWIWFLSALRLVE